MSDYHVFLVDGPLGGETFGLSIGSRTLPERLAFGKMPDGMRGVIGDWVLLPPYEPFDDSAPPWPVLVEYEFDPGASIMRAARGIVIYAHVEAE